jgi:hypothetical protein
LANRSDDFNRADAGSLGSPSDGGSAWVVVSGTWGISTNRGYKSASFGTNQSAYLEASASNGTVTGTIGGIASTSYPGLHIRFADDSNMVLVQCDTTFLKLWKIVAGTATQLGSTYSGTVAVNDVIALSANASNSLTIKQNGTTRVGPVTDSAGASNTKSGLRCYSNSAATASWDDFAFTEDAAAAASLIYSRPAIAPLLVR